MVHSSSTPPMKTPPSSPTSTVPATAPSLQVDPAVPPPGDTTDQHLNQIPGKSQLTDFTCNSDLTSPVLHDAPPTVPSIADLSSPSPLSSAQASINGRTSGRKRTPKACDCCGPNGAGHNDTTPGRGRGRGRVRGRGRGGRGRARGGSSSSSSSSELWHTPKRKVQGQWTHVKIFEDANKGGDSMEEMQTTETCETATETETRVGTSPPSLGGPIGSPAAPEKADVPGKDDTPVEDGHVGAIPPRVTAGGAEKGEDGAPDTQAEGGMAKSSVSSCATPILPQSGSLGPSRDAAKSLAGRPDEIAFKTPLLNGDTVSLSDSESEEDEAITSGVVNGRGAAGSQVQDLDCDMQVDQTPDKTTSESGTAAPRDGGESIASGGDHGSWTATDTEASHPPAFQGPIVVSLSQHLWALRDHRLYCDPGTWAKNETEEVTLGSDGAKINGELQDEGESRELLIDLIQEFLESSYMKFGSFIPLSENDVVEYLKNKGNSDLSSSGVDIKKEMTRYRVGLASAPIAGFMVTYNKHTLGLEDLGTLEEQNWLNDQIINMYGELIMEATQHKVHFFNSFFHKQLVAKGYDGVKRWTKKVDLFSKWLLLIPIHLEIHWSLVTVTMATKTISYYDSQGIVFRHTTDNILKYLLSEAKEKNQTAFQKGWKITIIKGIPQQKNDSDCGVFVLEYCRCLSVKRPLLFSQEDMPRIRKRIYKELCECRLDD